MVKGDYDQLGYWIREVELRWVIKLESSNDKITLFVRLYYYFVKNKIKYFVLNV